MMARFCRYVDKVFDLSELMQGLRDGRTEAHIPTASVWTSVLAMFAMRRGSLNAIETDLRQPKRLQQWVGEHRPSADTLGRVYARLDPDTQRQMLGQINAELKRNKVLAVSPAKAGQPRGLRWAAVDGHELFSSRSRCCPMCSRRTVTVKGQPLIEYYHRGVSCHLIGYEMAPPLDFELIRPGEGETVAARRMLERVLLNAPRFFDGVIGDALYLDAPTFNFCLDHGKHVLAVLKGEGRVLLNDVRGLLSLEPPQQWHEPDRVVQCWDIEGFNTLEGVKAPIRVLHAKELVTKRRRVAGEWVTETTDHEWYWATTVPREAMSSRQLWKIGHARWDIENDPFNTLSTHWSMDHCFKHDPTAIVNFILTLFITFVLLQSFYLRNLKPPYRRQFTLIGIACELYLGLATPGPPAPWLVRQSEHPC